MPRNVREVTYYSDTGQVAWVVLIFSVLILGGVAAVSRYALLTAVLDGLAAAAAVVPAVWGGFYLVRFLPFAKVSGPWHILVGAGLGLGLASQLILFLGVVGVLAHIASLTLLWKALLLLFVVAGILWLRSFLNLSAERAPRTPLGRSDAGLRGKWRYLWLVACPFMILAVLAAVIPPGFIWAEEGFGYDILEYHLQMPKEYFQAGRIAYCSHNVYANFPAGVEMLYLAAMLVNDEVYEIGTAANMIHMLFAILTVYATWVIGRDWSWPAGLVAGVSLATTGWLVYLSGLAYVENGMLFFGMGATGALLRAVRCGAGESRDEERVGGSVIRRERRWLALAGALAGFACGCKYTAGPLIALPLAICSALLPVRRLARRLGDLCVFAGMALVTFSPWLIKNQILTGSPVFPLAGHVFRASPPGWGPEETEHWRRGHALAAEERSVSALFGTLWRHIPGDAYQRFGPSLLLVAVVGLFGRRRDWTDALLGIILVVQLLVWLFATHLYARFAVPLLIPLALLAGRAACFQSAHSAVAAHIRFRLIVALVVAGAVWNFVFAARLYARESPGDAPASLLYNGEVPGLEYIGVVNNELDRNAKVLLVGDARAFYFVGDVDYYVVFNRNPFLAAMEKANLEAAAKYAVGYLRSRGYTHVLVNWSEVRRLAATYGFSPPTDEMQLRHLFASLPSTELALMQRFPDPRPTRPGEEPKPYVDLYKVIPPPE